MATVAGLTTKFHKELDDLLDNGVQQNALNQNEYDALKAVLYREEADLAPLKERDADRSKVIASLQTNMPTDSKALEKLQKDFATRHKSLVENLKNIQENQFNEFEQRLEDLGIDAGIQQVLLDHLRKAQQDRVDALQERAKIDAKSLEDPISDRNMQLSAAMILANLKIGAEKDSNATAGDLVQRWRPSGWATIKKGIMGIEKFGIGEKFTQWTGEDPDLFDEPGEIEAKFIKQGKFSPLKLQKKEGKWVYRQQEGAELLAIADPNHDKADDWNLSPVKDYFDQESHTYKEVGEAGAFRKKSAMSNLASIKSIPGAIKEALAPGSVGEFTISAKQIFPDKKRHLPGADHGLVCPCEGWIRDSQKIVRVGIMMHEAMARGWKGVDLSVLAERFREEAYLAGRRAGFKHEQITIKGGRIPDKWKAEGDKQRGRIEAVAKEKQGDLPTVIPKLALQLQSPDANVRPERFFDTARVGNAAARLQIFSDSMVSAGQRAAILADPAFSMAEIAQYIQSIMLVPEKAELIDALNKVHPERAVAAFKDAFALLVPADPAAQQAQLNDLFKGLSAEAQVSIMKLGGLADVDQQTLLKSLTADQRVELLKQSSLSSEEAYDVLRSQSGGADQIKILVKLADSIPNLTRVLVGMTLMPALPPLPAGTERGPRAAALALSVLYNQLPSSKRNELLKAFINDPAFSSKDREDIVTEINNRNAPLKAEELINAMSLENQILYVREVAYGPITSDFLKSQGIRDSQTQQKIVALETQLQNAHINFTGAAALTAPQKAALVTFINAYVTTDAKATLCVGIIRDLQQADQSEILLGIRPNTAIALLQGTASSPALPSTAMIAVRDQITAGNAAAREIFYQLSTKKAAEGLLLQPNANLAAQLSELVANAANQQQKNKVVNIVTTLGAKKVGEALIQMQPPQQQALKQLIVNQMNDPNIPPFLAQALGILHHDLVQQNQVNHNPVYQFSNADAAAILSHMNDSAVITQIINADELDAIGQPQPRTDTDNADILVKISDNAQKAKVFGGLQAHQQRAIFQEPAFNQAQKIAVFHRMADAEQTHHLNTIAPNLNQAGQPGIDAANNIVAFLSSPGLSKARQTALWGTLQLVHQNNTLSKAIKPSAVFLMMVLEAAGDKAAMFNNIVGGRLGAPVLSDYLEKVAQALAGLTSLTSAQLSGLFVAELNNQPGADGGAIRTLRVNILTQLVMQGHPEKAKALFNAIPAGAEKDALKQAVVTAVERSQFKTALHQVVGHTPPPAAPAPGGP